MGCSSSGSRVPVKKIIIIAIAVFIAERPSAGVYSEFSTAFPFPTKRKTESAKAACSPAYSHGVYWDD
jgi:hypothetical protein